jgi:hypothetical protein
MGRDLAFEPFRIAVIATLAAKSSRSALLLHVTDVAAVTA